MIKIDWKTCLRVGVSVFLVFLCIFYWSGVSGFLKGIVSASAPLLLGAILAFVVNVLMGAFERWYFPNSRKKIVLRTRRPLCLFLAYATLLLVVSAVFWIVIPQLFSCIVLIVEKLPGVIQTTVKSMQEWDFVPDFVYRELAAVDWSSRINQIIDIAGKGVLDVVNLLISAVATVFSAILSLIIAVIFSIYLLCSKERLARQAKNVLVHFVPETWVTRFLYFLRTFSESFRGYIVGQTTEAIILGCLVTVGMLLLRLPYATMIGALVAVLAFIPIAGAYISGGIGALMLLSESPQEALVFVIFLVIIQQIEGNLIYPRVVGSTMQLPGIWVLVAVTLGGGLFGIGGMILAVPLTATVYQLLKNEVYKKQPSAVSEETAREEASSETTVAE